MKKILLATMIAATVISSCTDEYDDSKLWDKQEEQDKRLDELEASIQKLQEDIAKLQEDVSKKADLTELTALVQRVTTLEATVTSNDATNKAKINALKSELEGLIDEKINSLKDLIPTSNNEAEIANLKAEIANLKNLLKDLKANANLTVFYYDYKEAQVMAKKATATWESIAPTINDEDGAEAEYRIIGVRPSDKFDRISACYNEENNETTIGEFWLDYFEEYSENPWFEIDKYTGVVSTKKDVYVPVNKYVIGVMAVDRKNIGVTDFMAIRTIEFESTKDLAIKEIENVSLLTTDDTYTVNLTSNYNTISENTVEYTIGLAFDNYLASIMGCNHVDNTIDIVAENFSNFKNAYHFATTKTVSVDAVEIKDSENIAERINFDVTVDYPTLDVDKFTFAKQDYVGEEAVVKGEEKVTGAYKYDGVDNGNTPKDTEFRFTFGTTTNTTNVTINKDEETETLTILNDYSVTLNRLTGVLTFKGQKSGQKDVTIYVKDTHHSNVQYANIDGDSFNGTEISKSFTFNFFIDNKEDNTPKL